MTTEIQMIMTRMKSLDTTLLAAQKLTSLNLLDGLLREGGVMGGATSHSPCSPGEEIFMPGPDIGFLKVRR